MAITSVWRLAGAQSLPFTTSKANDLEWAVQPPPSGAASHCSWPWPAPLTRVDLGPSFLLRLGIQTAGSRSRTQPGYCRPPSRPRGPLGLVGWGWMAASSPLCWSSVSACPDGYWPWSLLSAGCPVPPSPASCVWAHLLVCCTQRSPT